MQNGNETLHFVISTEESSNQDSKIGLGAVPEAAPVLIKWKLMLKLSQAEAEDEQSYHLEDTELMRSC
jgi:hypothetical protein